MKGSYVALVTPLNRDGLVDFKALERLVDWHLESGTDGLVCAATTGEGVCLEEEERLAIFRLCVEKAAGRMKILASTGASSTLQTARNTERAQKCGVDGVLVVTPFYNRPTQRGMVAHFKEVAKVGVPVVAYHNPARAAIRLEYETICEIAPYLAAIKDSSHDEAFIEKICKVLPVFAGDDDMTLKTIRLGGIGCIGVTPNVMAGPWKQMVALALQGDLQKAEGLFQGFLPLIAALFTETNPQGPKYALSVLGRCEPVLRAPMTLPLEENQRKIREALEIYLSMNV